MLPVDPTDRAIRDAILDTLIWQTEFDIEHLDIDVRNEIVFLWGEVHSGGERDTTERVIRDVRGVRSVVNRLTSQADRREIADAL